MARMRHTYSYLFDEEEESYGWYQNSQTIDIDNYLFRDISSVEEVDSLNQYTYAKVDGHLCHVSEISKEGLKDKVTALLMDANYAYKENGHTLFSNQPDGTNITGFVELTEIKDLDDAQDAEQKENFSFKFATQPGIVHSRVGGFLCTKDKKTYQFSGLIFDDSVDGGDDVKGNFKLKSKETTKGFGFINRKPIVLWENFYNFDKLEDVPSFEIVND